MARKIFYSYHYKPDKWRALQVRYMGILDGNQPVVDNEWEKITRGGDDCIKKWISAQLDGRSCVVVLIGSNTAGRKWINYEIMQGWNAGKGVLGIHIHNLLDNNQAQSPRGRNPFEGIEYGDSGKKLSSVVKAYDPPYLTSKYVYDHIISHLAAWVDEAVSIRKNFGTGEFWRFDHGGFPTWSPSPGEP